MKTWTELKLEPFNSKSMDVRKQVYCLILFTDRQALLINRNYGLMTVIPREPAQQLLIEAGEQNIIADRWAGYTGGPRPPEYPEEAETAFWFDLGL